MDEAIAKLKDAVNKLNKASNDLKVKEDKIKKAITMEEDRFKGLVTGLEKFIPGKVEDVSKVPSDTIHLPKFLAVQYTALKYYGLLANLRVTFMRAVQRSPNVTREAIINAVLLSAKADVTHQELEGIYDVLVKYSEGLKNLPK